MSKSIDDLNKGLAAIGAGKARIELATVSFNTNVANGFMVQHAIRLALFDATRSLTNPDKSYEKAMQAAGVEIEAYPIETSNAFGGSAAETSSAPQPEPIPTAPTVVGPIVVEQINGSRPSDKVQRESRHIGLYFVNAIFGLVVAAIILVIVIYVKGGFHYLFGHGVVSWVLTATFVAVPLAGLLIGLYTAHRTILALSNKRAAGATASVSSEPTH